MNENNPYNTEGQHTPSRLEQQAPDYRYKKPSNHIWIGCLLLIIGVVYLLKKMGIPMPDFLFSWPMIVIAVGIFIGIRKNFEGADWAIITIIGIVFLSNKYFFHGDLWNFILPIILIGSGLFFLLRPGRKKKSIQIGDDGDKSLASVSEQDYIDVTSIFGGSKKKIFSKNFTGGEMVNIFGGSEIDLTQADMNGSAVLDVTTLFGGATLLVPSHWTVVSNEAVAIFGEIKDRRSMQNLPENNKVLLIKGTVLFGGIDVKSY